MGEPEGPERAMDLFRSLPSWFLPFLRGLRAGGIWRLRTGGGLPRAPQSDVVPPPDEPLSKLESPRLAGWSRGAPVLNEGALS